jgi:hypothetical protein
MPRSVARKVAWAGRTASALFGPKLARNGGGENVPTEAHGVARGSGSPIEQAGASAQPDGRDAA